MKGLETTMTPEQICDLLDISVNTLKGQFKRMAAKAEKKGYKLTKEGRGANTKYYLESLAPRAKTLFEEESKDMNLDKESLSLDNWELNILLATLLTPMRIFRGTEKEFLEYLDVSIQTSNRKKIKEAIDSMVKKDYILKIEDKDILIITIKRQFELDLELKTDIVSKSKKIATKHNIRDWQNVFKVWLSIKILCTTFDTRITAKDITKSTGLTEKMINKCIKALEKENCINSKKIFAKIDTDNGKSFVRCSGRIVNENAFEN